MKFPTLYKLNVRGKLMKWKIWTEDNVVHTKNGLVDGKQTLRERIMKKVSGKTAEEKADAFAEKKWTDQKEKKDYTEEKPDPDAEVDLFKTFRVMCAQNAKAVKPKFPCYISKKHDGFRISFRYNKETEKVTAHTRSGKIIPAKLKILRKQAKELILFLIKFLDVENVILDGELIVDDLTFQEIQKIVMLKKGKHEREDEVRLKLFDIVWDLKAKNKKRYKKMVEAYGEFKSRIPNIDLVECHLVENMKEVKKFHKAYVRDEDGEGTILRDPEAAYQCRKCRAVLKLKDTEDEEAVIIGGEEAEGTHAGTVIWYVKGRETKKKYMAKPMGKHEDRQKYWENLDDYIGKVVVVKYEGLTDDGKPRFPRVKGFRDKEDLDASDED